MAHRALTSLAVALALGSALSCLPQSNVVVLRETAVPGKFGTVSFPLSCAPRVRSEFNEGLALLHSFWHDEAYASFERVASSDPNCALAYWGEAMTHFHQLLSTPTDADIQAGAAELHKADLAQEKSSLEIAYIRALHLFFDGYAPELYQQHAASYADAMAKVARTNPHDLEVQAFYSLALLASAPQNETLINQRKAVAILGPLFQLHPNHPGIAHYIIHACDNPRMAQLGLRAARHYAEIAPRVPHALHMPAHIFTRLGLWQDDIQTNLASKAAAEASGLHRGAENRLHAMEFLEYAYLQQGKFEEAAAIVAEAKTIAPSDVNPRYPDMWPSVEARYPALLAIETKDWTAAKHLPDAKGPVGRESMLLARAEGAAHLHDRDAAIETLTQIETSSKTATSIEIRAWVAFARGELKQATEILQPLVERQAKVGKGEVEIPACEMLADMLLLSGRFDEALGLYQQSLVTDPNRFNALLGAIESAGKLGRNDLAARYYRVLARNRPNVDGSAAAEMNEARRWSNQ